MASRFLILVYLGPSLFVSDSLALSIQAGGIFLPLFTAEKGLTTLPFDA
jgi:hypothetical protein